MNRTDINLPTQRPEPSGQPARKGKRRYERRKKRKPSWLMRLFRALILFVFIVVILLAVVIGVGRTYLDANPELKLQMTEEISSRLGVPVRSEDVSVRWRWSGPQITIDRLQFLHPKSKQALLEFNQAQVILDIRRFVETGMLGVSSIELQGAELVLERMPGNELSVNQNSKSQWQQLFKVSGNSTTDNEFRLPNGIFNLEDITLVYKDRITEEEVRVDNIDLRVDKNDQLLALDLNIDADQFDTNPLADHISISASTPNPDLHDHFEWQVLFACEALRLSKITQQWQSLKPLFINEVKPGMQAYSEPLKISQGQGDINVLLRVSGTEVQSMNGTFALNALKFSQAQEELDALVSDFGFRFSYENDSEFTRFKADKIQVSAADKVWPQENNLQLNLLKFAGEDYQSNKSAIQRMADDDAAQAEVKKGIETASDPVSKIKESPAATPTTQESASISADTDAADTHAIKMAELKVTYLDLAHIAPLLEVFVQQMPDRAKLPDFVWEQLGGELRQLSITAGDETQLAGQALAVKQASAQFKRLSVPSVNKGLSLQGLDGGLNFSEDQGTLVLSSDEFAYVDLNVFRNRLVLDKLKTELTFVRDKGAWQVNAESIQLENNDFSINANLDILLQKNQSPVLDIQGLINPINIDNIKHYYPAKIMKPKLLAWLENGVSGGQVESAKFKFKGALADYPFRNGKGEFLIEHDVKNMDIRYIKNWPLATVQEANVVYKNQGFEINATKVKTGGLRVFPLNLRIADFKTGLLELDIKTPLDMARWRVWVNNSPLKRTIGKTLGHVQFSGEAQSVFALQVPLKDITRFELQGTLEFPGNPLVLDMLKAPMGNFSGTFAYTKDTLSSDNLQANYLGQLLTADIHTQNKDILIAVHTDAQLAVLLGEPYAQYLSGNSNLDAVIRISPKTEERDGGVQDIKVHSNLLGASVLLPAPFDKSKDSILPLDLNIGVVTNSATQKVEKLLLTGHVGDTRIRSRLNAVNMDAPPAEREWLLHSMTLVGGDNENLFATMDPAPARIHMLGEYSYINFDDWLEFVNQDRDSQADEALELGVIDAAFDELVAVGQSFANAKVLMLPTATSWKADISNEQVTGRITFPRPWTETSRIQADLEKYHLKLPEDESEEASLDPREIPNVSVRIQNFQYAEMPLGETRFRINQKNNGAQLQTFDIKSPTFTITGNGGWYKTTEGETSLITLQLNSNDLIKTLTQLGYAPSASAQSAEAMIELSWPSSPFGDILSELSGTVSFKLLNGELREVEPGAGRFLALLSIAQLPKRLSLDFRDVFNAGLGYEELSADFLIQSGQAYTDNMLMRGPVADLGVIGRIGLATRDFDQAAVVQADLGSSLPIAGALAGGVGVGAAMLIFSEIFKNPLKQATQVFYKIDGDWGDPKIKRTPASELQEVPVAPQ